MIALSRRIPSLEGRLLSKRWQVRYQLLPGADSPADEPAKALLEYLVADPHPRVACEATIRYLDGWHSVRRGLFVPRLCLYEDAVFDTSSDKKIRDLVEYCLTNKSYPRTGRLPPLFASGDPRAFTQQGCPVGSPVDYSITAEIVGILGDRRDAHRLAPWLNNPNSYVVTNVAAALIRLGDRSSAIQALEKLIQTGTERDRYYVDKAVRTLEGLGVSPPPIPAALPDEPKEAAEPSPSKFDWSSLPPQPPGFSELDTTLDAGADRLKPYFQLRTNVFDVSTEGKVRELVDYCLGDGEFPIKKGCHVCGPPGPAFSPWSLEAIQIVGLFGSPADAMRLHPSGKSADGSIAIAAAISLERLGDRKEAVQALNRLLGGDVRTSLHHITRALKLLQKLGLGKDAARLKMLGVLNRVERHSASTWMPGLTEFLLFAADQGIRAW